MEKERIIWRNTICWSNIVPKRLKGTPRFTKNNRLCENCRKEHACQKYKGMFLCDGCYLLIKEIAIREGFDRGEEDE